MNDVIAAAPAHRTYDFILPPGWRRFHLRRPLGPQAESYAAQALAGRNLRDRGPLAQRQLAQRMSAMLTAAAERGVTDLALPVTPEQGGVSGASFVITPLSLPDDADPMEFLVALASRDDTAQLVEIRDLVALRTARRQPREIADPAGEIMAAADDFGVGGLAAELAAELGGRHYDNRVQYFIGHPERPADWIMVAFSAGDDDSATSRELAEALVALFDQIMLSVRYHA
ncbi:MAG: hypothetical protein LBH76_04425 [Propionibacteriaceae bacterium]|jgi:hypothetical protein|nr:hypothetical protein [Propionibacteriaceae bacterium]